MTKLKKYKRNPEKFQEQINRFLSKLNKNFELIEYKSHKDVTVKCKICGKIRHTTADNIIRFGCKKCAQSHMPQCTSMSQNEFILRSKTIHKNKYNYSLVKYINYKTPVGIICPIHGIFYLSPNKHLIGQGCPKCSGKNITKEEFVHKASELYGNFYDYSKCNFINMTTPVMITCPIHGDFIVTPSDHIHLNCGCKLCHESLGEKLTNNILQNLNLLFVREKQIIIDNHKYRVDFYFKFNDNKYIIEYNGSLHYYPSNKFGGIMLLQKQLERDKKIREYCIQNNINLLEIKFTEKDVKKLIYDFLNVPST